MTLTLITSTYNSKKHIATCLQSVAAQDYPHIEHLIIDGRSNDDTIKIIEHSGYLQRRGVKLISEEDQGIYDALNKGIAMASSDVIGFLHSDDLLESSTVISDIVNTFKEFDCDGVYGDLVYVKENDTDQVVRYWKSSDFRPELLRRGWMPAHPTLFLNRRVYGERGSFNTDYRIAADYEFILRVFKEKSYTFHSLPQVLVRMRLGGLSNSGIKNLIRKSKEDLKALKAHKVGGIFVVLRKILGKIGQFGR